MRRISLALLVVSLALGVPVGLLAWRALDGLAYERSLRHSAVAERAFDEMESALSGFLEREEQRPFEQYRFYLGVSGERSPLATLAQEEFVIGAFQIDPDGTVHTPLRPRDSAAARNRGDWPADERVSRAIDTLQRVVGDAWRGQGLEGGAAAATRAAQTPSPGKTRRAGLASELSDEDNVAASERKESAYDVLQSLNRAAVKREARKQQRTEAPQYAVSELESVRGRMAQERLADEAEVPYEEEFQKKKDARDVELDDVVQRANLQSLGVAKSVPQAAAPAEMREAAAADAKRVVRIVLDPMVGRLVDGHLLLYRTVLVGEQGYRQGLLLDRAALGRWLEREVVAPSRLAGMARTSFGTAAQSLPESADPHNHVFDHRFAEPFDAVTARLELTPIPGVASPNTIYALVGALVALAAVGLFAIHRMVSVVVQFAERRNNFVAAVTHELKTPLTAIRMYGEMLRDGLVGADTKREEYYATIADESERLSRLVDNVLEFSRLEKGSREMNLRAGPIGPIVHEVGERLRAHAAREGFDLEIEVGSELPAVRFDRDALVQVLFNLVDNAMKYARDAESKRVVVQALRVPEGVSVSVRDFGPGVPARQIAHIFEPFYRGGDELTRTTKGTGIGLALVKELAERMGAAVSGANAEDGGFRVGLAFRAS